jgi:hypothetical protein
VKGVGLRLGRGTRQTDVSGGDKQTVQGMEVYYGINEFPKILEKEYLDILIAIS